MQKLYTSRLFYKKYPYRILLTRSVRMKDPQYHSDWTPFICQSYLNEKEVDYKIYSQVRHKGSEKNPIVIMNSSLFLKTRKDFDHCLSRWNSYVMSITVPFDDKSIEVLEKNTEVVIRQKLLFKKYRFVISFNRGYKEPLDDLNSWIEENLQATVPDGYKWSPAGWRPRLYLCDESNLLLVKLTWGDKIRGITVVRTFDEIAADSTMP
jgi:hypothetical protein